MGFKIDCPNCGPRSYHEFWFGGELRRYDPDCTDEEDYRNTWLRANSAGPQQERWFHYAGCRRWLTLERDTVNNTVTPLQVNPLGG
jgi:heterotetrameric sarcosine oxidase delta subunit